MKMGSMARILGLWQKTGTPWRNNGWGDGRGTSACAMHQLFLLTGWDKALEAKQEVIDAEHKIVVEAILHQQQIASMECGPCDACVEYLAAAAEMTNPGPAHVSQQFGEDAFSSAQSYASMVGNIGQKDKTVRCPFFRFNAIEAVHNGETMWEFLTYDGDFNGTLVPCLNESDEVSGWVIHLNDDHHVPPDVIGALLYQAWGDIQIPVPDECDPDVFVPMSTMDEWNFSGLQWPIQEADPLLMPVAIRPG